MFVKIYTVIYYYVDKWVEYHSEYARHMRITNKESWDIIEEYMENKQTGNVEDDDIVIEEDENDEDDDESITEDVDEISLDNLPTIISLEGNIGSGKSTLLHKLKEFCPEFLQKHGIVIIQEPVNDWLEYKDPTDNESILTKFYKDPPRYAFLFQLIIYESFVNAIEDALEKNPQANVFLCERSIVSSLKVFANMLADDCTMSPLEMKFYKELLNDDVRHRYYPDKIIYLTTPVHTCMERIKSRSRENEPNITKEYVTRCDRYHHDWLDEIYDSCEKNELVYLNSDVDLPYLQNVLKQMLPNFVGYRVGTEAYEVSSEED
jgi:deoxyadenosine/deoxycytidine kinase